jgi:ATP synthase protein I
MAKPEPPSFEDFSARLGEARRAREEAERPSRGEHRQFGIAYRVAIEMAAGVAVGAFLGWWLDAWLGTRPVFLLVLGPMGFAAGVLNAWRAAQAAARAGEGEDRRG